MLIDWFTLTAQIVNFTILVWLLKRFLWSKLIKAIDDRENRIAERLAEADHKNKTADQHLAEINAQSAEQQRQSSVLLEQARSEATELRLELTQQARDGVRKQEAEWREDLEREKAALLDEIRQRAGAEILEVVRRALADLACTDIQKCAADVFVERLQTVDESSLRDLASDGAIQVLSATDLPDDTRRKIGSTLTGRLGRAVQLEFARNPALSWGLELRSNGRSLAWTPASYLESLDDGLRRALEARPKPLVG